MQPKKFKSILLLILITIGLLFLLANSKIVWDIICIITVVLMPFVVGFAIAYILNKPYMFFAEKAFAGMKNNPKYDRLRKPLALVTAYVIVFGLLVFLVAILIPQLVSSSEQLVTNFRTYANSFQEMTTSFLQNYLHIQIAEDNNFFQFINQIVKLVTGGELDTLIKNMFNSIAPNIFDITKNVTSVLYNIGMGFVVSFYFLACKDKLIFQTKKLIFAWMPERTIPKIMEVGNLSNDMFGKFILGKLLDSAIMGGLCFIGMTAFRFDYALLISVIIGITNVIPVFGPFIGAVPSVFIMLMINPMEAIWFTIFLVVLQQIDGNIIGPKILGSSIGISGFWIMSSVIIGGGLFGVLGMILAVPVFSTIYALFGETVNNRIAKRGYTEEFSIDPNADVIGNNKNKEHGLYAAIKRKIFIKESASESKKSKNKKKINTENNDKDNVDK